MGLNIQTLQLLNNTKEIKKGNLKVLTIGRQAVRFTNKDFRQISKQFDYPQEDLEKSVKDSDNFCENLLNYI